MVFQVSSFPQVSSPKPCMHLSSPPYVLHALAYLGRLALITLEIFGDEYCVYQLHYIDCIRIYEMFHFGVGLRGITCVAEPSLLWPHTGMCYTQFHGTLK